MIEKDSEWILPENLRKQEERERKEILFMMSRVWDSNPPTSDYEKYVLQSIIPISSNIM